MSVSVVVHAGFILLVAWRPDDAPDPVSRADLVVSLDSRDAVGDDLLPSPEAASASVTTPQEADVLGNQPLNW